MSNHPDFLSGPQAAKVIGVHNNRVLYWEAQGLLKATRIVGDKRDVLLFPREEVEDFRDKRAWPTLQEVSRWTGVTMKALSLLVEAGYIAAVPVDSLMKVKWRADIDTVKTAMERVATILAETLLDKDQESLRNWKMRRWLEANLPKRRVSEVAERMSRK